MPVQDCLSLEQYGGLVADAKSVSIYLKDDIDELIGIRLDNGLAPRIGHKRLLKPWTLFTDSWVIELIRHIRYRFE